MEARPAPLIPTVRVRDTITKSCVPRKEAMNDAALKGFITLIPMCALFAGTVVIWLRSRSTSSILQFLGATSLLVVVLIHVFEGLRIFPWMGWGLKNSIGHYLDMLCAILGFTLFPVGYLIHAVKMRAEDKIEERESK